jgi:peptide/nickel transport system permease protein
MGNFFARMFDSDIWFSFKQRPIVMLAALVVFLCVFCATFASFVAPHNPFDLKTLELSNAFTSPAWTANGKATFLLGTDDQGRDLLSAIMFGSRTSIIVAVIAVMLSMTIGISLGLLSGYLGGKLDAFIMRVADVQLSFPAILIALLIDGVARAVMPKGSHDSVAVLVLIFAIALSGWVQYARTVRGSTLVERNKEYVQAARVIGRHPMAIMFTHVLPNVLGPVLVLATLQVGSAILIEGTLSYLGVGVPPTQPSLGTLIRVGNDFLNSGEWWITVFPGLALVMLVLAINIVGDWLRDVMNPKLN